MDSEGNLRIILLEFIRKDLGGQGELQRLAAAQKSKMKEENSTPFELNQYEVSHLARRWVQEKSRKTQSTRESVLGHWLALESNTFLCNSEKGTGLPQSRGQGRLHEWWSRGASGKELISLMWCLFVCLFFLSTSLAWWICLSEGYSLNQVTSCLKEINSWGNNKSACPPRCRFHSSDLKERACPQRASSA